MAVTKLALLYLLLSLWAIAQADVFEVTGIGIASGTQAGSRSELRQRALESAEYEAVRRAGVDVSHKHVLRDRESVDGNNTRQSREYKRETRSTGRYEIRLLEILEEKWRGDDYFVRARIEVIYPEDAEIKLGDLWEAAGKPAIVLELSETRNGSTRHNPQNRMRDFLLGNLSKHGVQTQESGAAIRLSVLQYADIRPSTEIEGMRVHPAHCRLSFQIYRPPALTAMAKYAEHAGPVAGFDRDGAAEACYQKIALPLAKRLLRNLEAQLRDIWQNGTFYQVVIKVADDRNSAGIMDIMRARAHDFSATLIDLQGQQMRWHVVYDSAVEQLATELVDMLKHYDVPITVVGISGNTIFLSERI